MRKSRPKAGPVTGYGIALLSVSITLAVTYWTWPALQQTPWALFFAAVMISAWIGGMGPSLFATVISAVLGNYFFIAPYRILSFERDALIPTATFVLVSVFIGLLASARRRAEMYERTERKRFQATMVSIGDAVIATDPEGRVTFMNGIAEGLTGWTSGAAEGKRLEEVFVIINEATRAAAPNPVEKVLETGRIQGLANHTILIAKDGSERPIDDSAAPIRDDTGKLAGVVLVFRDITERKKAEADQARLAAIVESSDDAILGKTLDGVIQYWNGGAQRIFGYTPKEAVGQPITLIIPPERRDEERVILDRLRRGERIEHFDTVRVAKDGRRVDISLTVSPIRDSDGRVIGASKVARDVTERRAAEAERSRLSERLALALEAADLGTWDWDEATDHILLSDRGAAIFGLAPGQLYSREWMSGLIHPDDRDRAREEASRAVAERTDYDIEYRLDRPDGEPTWVSARGRGVYGPDGRLARMLGVVQDVTVRKLAEESLRLSEGQHRALSELAAATQPLTDPAAIVEASARVLAEHLRADRCAYAEVEGGATFVVTGDHTRGVPSIAGQWPVAAFGSECLRLMLANRPYVVDDAESDPRIGPDDLPAYRATAIRAVVCVPLHKNGVFTAAMAVHHATPRHWTAAEVDLVTIVVGRCWEALERSRVARHLRAKDELLKLLIDNIRDYAVIIADPRGTVLEWQGGTERITGYAPDEAIGKGPELLFTPEDMAEGRPAVEMANAAQDGRAEDRRWHLRKGGERFYADGVMTALYDEAGKLRGFGKVFKDATREKQVEEELRENDRQKDEFLAMLAHELRNPLSAVANAVVVLKMSLAPDDLGFARDVITRQMQHLTRLIDDLLDVSRISRGKIDLRKEVIEATPVLDSAADCVRALVAERKHTLDISIDRGNLWLEADPTRLEQVVVNLLNNAAKYSENEGYIRLSAYTEAGEVVIRVEDRGVGIPPEKLPQMFELFAQGDRSLARSEGGLGIGLTVVKNLVEMHGGTVTARSEGIGWGSEFTIRLPAAEKGAAGAQKQSPERPQERRAKILVVDDNEDTARGMARLLRLLGHEVATAHSGPEGIETAKEHQPDFILLDIGLPGMDGYEVVSQLRREDRCKDAVIIAVSGYGQEEDRRRSKEAGFDYHLLKPLDHDALLTLLANGGNGRM